MRLQRALWTCVLLTVPVGVLRADVHPIYVYPCARANTPIRMDGRLDEPCWQQSPVVSGFTLFQKRTVVDPQTSFRVVHDDANLYLGIVLDEPLVPKLAKTSPDARDSRTAFRHECIELFIDPRHDHAEYYQFAASLTETIYDARAMDPTWNSRLRVATRLGKTSWTMELALPMAELGVTRLRPGMVIGFNVCRDREIGPERQWSHWAVVDGGFHDPVRFAHLVLSPTPEQLGSLGAEFRQGGREGPIHIFGSGRFSGVAYIVLERAALGALDKMIVDLDAICRQEKSPQVAADLRRRIAAVQKQADPIRRKLAGAAQLDAAEWIRMDLTLKSLTMRLGQSLWRARIEGLLQSI